MGRGRDKIQIIATQRTYPSMFSEHVQRYMYPPEIAVAPVDGATSYRLRMADSKDVITECDSSTGRFDLGPVWSQLAEGFVRFNSIAMFPDGSERNFGYSCSLFKAAQFCASSELDVDELCDGLAKAVHDNYAFLVHRRLPHSFDPHLPPLIWHAVYRCEDEELYPEVYPGLHFGNYIDFFDRYSTRFPENRVDAEQIARRLSENARMLTTPEEYEWSRFPYSTITSGQPGGEFELEDTVQPVKAAMLGCALYDHHRLVGDPDGLEFAKHWADVLAAKQAADGSLPYRVNARTGAEVSGGGRSTSLVFAINLWERLDSSGEERYGHNRARALSWLQTGPASHMRWVADFEDIPTSISGENSTNFDNLDAMATAHFLLRHRAEDPASVDEAAALSRWIEEGFVFYQSEHPVDFMRFPAPAVMEQATHYYPISGHLAGFGNLQLALYKATGDPAYRDKALACAAALLQYVRDDGVLLTYAPDRAIGYGYNDTVWFGCTARVCIYFIKLMTALDRWDGPAGSTEQ